MRRGSFKPTSAFVTRATGGTLARSDTVHGGAYHVRGTVTVAGTPARRRVVLFDGPMGQLPLRAIRATWSAANGAYSFDRIADREYIVVAFDYTRDKNAAIADFVRPEPMP